MLSDREPGQQEQQRVFVFSISQRGRRRIGEATKHVHKVEIEGQTGKNEKGKEIMSLVIKFARPLHRLLHFPHRPYFILGADLWICSS